MLARGNTATEISNLTGVHKVTISKYVKEFINKKWIKCTNKGAYEKKYRATPKAPIYQREKSINLSGSARKKYRIHNICFKYILNEKPRRKINWHKTIPLKNNIQHLFYFKEDIQTIAYYEKSNTALIWIKERQYNNPHDWEQEKKELMNTSLLWLQKFLLCKISKVTQVSKTHYAKPVENPAIMNALLSTDGNIVVGDVWIDGSVEFGEIESTNPDMITTKRFMEWADQNVPQRVTDLENIMDKLTINVGKMAEAQLDMTEQMQRTNRQLTAILNPNQQQLFTKPKDDKMFG